MREESAVVLKTLEGILNPDGRIVLPPEELPEHPVRVMVTILEVEESAALFEPGDYLDQLADYEERLARGEVQWQLETIQ
jgi:hypothetical protein